MGTLFVTEFVTAHGAAQAPPGPDEDRSGDSVCEGCQAPYGTADGGENLIFAQAAPWTRYCWGAGRTRSSRVGVN
jgi:hypothetical protein